MDALSRETIEASDFPRAKTAAINRLELAPSTVKLTHQHLVGAFECAIEDRLIVTNPARGVKLPGRTHKQVQPISTADLDALIEVVAKRNLCHSKQQTCQQAERREHQFHGGLLVL